MEPGLDGTRKVVVGGLAAQLHPSQEAGQAVRGEGGDDQGGRADGHPH